MKKNEIFTFTAPNGVEVTAVVVHTIFQGNAKQLDICYAQNRLFTLVEWEIAKDKGFNYNGETIVDYCVLPEYDAMLETEQLKLDADDFYEAVGNVCEMIVDGSFEDDTLTSDNRTKVYNDSWIQ